MQRAKERTDMRPPRPVRSAAALAAAWLAWAAAPACRAHGDAHDAPRRDDASTIQDTAFGRAGEPRRVTRTIRIDMSDAMRFTPDELTVERGQTVRLLVSNRGRVLHELVLGTPEELQRHAELMRRFPDMEHADAHMVHVRPSRSGEIVWQFTRPGTFAFACLIPGHYEAGMVGRVNVR